MKKTFLIIVTICLSTVFSDAQNLLIPDTIINRLWQQTHIYPNEKIHLQNDKPIYAGGDTIWFRTFLVNAINNCPETISRYIYTELINPFGEAVSRVKIRQDKDSLYYGYLPLPEEVPGGEYTLRAYTRYMENNDEESFFRKPVQIVSPLNKSLSPSVRFEGEPGQKTVNAYIELINTETQEKISMQNVSFYDENGSVEHWQNGDKLRRLKLKPDQYKQKVIKLEAANFQQFLPISLPANDYQVDFLPEGGNLPAGVLSKMAFKALNNYGLSETVTGVIKDESGKEICSFRTTHAGMGYFSWIPEAGKRYYAECTSASGVKKQFDLPEVETDTYTLKVQEARGKYYISILTSPEASTSDTMNILIHQHGYPLLVQPITPSPGNISIDKEGLSSGIIHILLLNANNRIVSERLAFVQNDDQASATIQPDKESYSQREKVALSVTLKDAEGKPATGNFSIAVTDNRDVLPDSSYTIYSSLLLTSDLRGHIEDPGWYFREKEKERIEGLDLLMLTQGWRKYNIENALSADYKQPEIHPEICQSLSGSIRRLVLDKAIPNSHIRIYAPQQKMLEEVISDKNGKFELAPFEFPDSTQYYAYATTEKGGKNILLTLDPESFPAINKQWPLRKYSNTDSGETLTDIPVSVEFLDKIDRKMTYQNGMRTVFLEEVVVTGKKKVYNTPFESIPAALTLRQEDMKKSPMKDLGSFITSRASGILYENGTFYSLRSGDFKIIIDEMPIIDDPNSNNGLASIIVQTLRTEDIEQIDISQNPMDGLAWFPMTGAPFIAIKLRKDADRYNQRPRNIQNIQLLGYQKPASFYSPKYETRQQKENEAPDLRTTIYWQPNVLTDSNGNARIEFYTADGDVSYSILLEGITQDGKLIREIKEIGSSF